MNLCNKFKFSLRSRFNSKKLVACLRVTSYFQITAGCEKDFVNIPGKNGIKSGPEINPVKMNKIQLPMLPGFHSSY